MECIIVYINIKLNMFTLSLGTGQLHRAFKCSAFNFSIKKHKL